MIFIVSIRNLEKWSSNKLKNEISHLVKNKNTSAALNILRKSGICICEYGTGKTKNFKLYKELMSYIKINYNDIEQINSFENEVKLLNIIFKKFNETQIKIIENNIDSKYELNAYLIALELALRQLYDNVLTTNNLSPDEKLNLEDGIKVSTGNVLSYLKDFKKCNIHLNCFIEKKHIKIAEAHITAATNKNFLKNMKDLWCYYDISIKEIENIIYIRNTSVLGLGKNITQLTFLDMRNAKIHAHLLEQYHRNNKNFNTLDTFDIEELSKRFLFEDLFIDNLNTEIKNIPLEYYIKAYSTISKVAKNFIKNSKIYNSNLYRLEDFCLIKDKNDWKIIFEENGIPLKYVDGIVKFLIFNKNSRDLMDSPFICFENKIIPRLFTSQNKIPEKS